MENNSNQSEVIVKKHRFSLYWLVPILATIITISLIWSNTFNKGELVTLTMDDAAGIEAGKTLVKLRSVDVGLVESVSLSDDYRTTKVKVRMKPNMEELLRQDSLFWLVKPRIDSTSITGLDTLLSGTYIQMYKGTSKEKQNSFECLKSPPYGIDEKGVMIKLVGFNNSIVKAGVQINYKGFNIGVVVDSTYDVKRKLIIYEAKIQKKYSSLVNDQSVFWVDSGVDINLGPSGVDFSMPSLDNLITGSINVYKFNYEDSNPITDKKSEFNLYKNYETAKYENLKASNPKYVVMVDTDTMNVEEGSSVLMRGIKIGEVIRKPWFENRENLFNLDKKIPLLIILDTNKEESAAALRVFTKMLKANSLCAQIGSNSILSAGNYINLVVDNKQKCKSKSLTFRNVPVIPLIENSSMSSELHKLATKVNEIDFKGISTNVNNSLHDLDLIIKSINKITDSVTKNKTIEKFNSTVSSYNSQSDLYRSLIDTVNKLNQSLRDIDPTIKKVGQKSNSLVFGSEQTDIEPVVSKE